MLERGALVGLLFAHEDHRRRWTADEVASVRTVADRAYAVVAKLQVEAA